METFDQLVLASFAFIAAITPFILARSTAPDTSCSPSTERTFLFIGVGHSIVFPIIFFVFPVIYIYTISEDGWLEWMTFYLFLAASVTGVYGSVRILGSDRPAAWFGLLLSFGCFMVAMEEVSWGQRIFSLETPSLFLEQNSQREINLHNLFMGPGKGLHNLIKRCAFYVILVYAVVIPVALAFSGRFRPASRWAVPTPGMMPIFLLAALMLMSFQRYRTEEIAEYLLGLGMLCVLLRFSTGLAKSTLKPAWFAGGLAVLFTLSLGTAQLTQSSPEERKRSRNILQYYFYSFALKRYPSDHLWGMSEKTLNYAAENGFENQHTFLYLSQVASKQQDTVMARHYLELAAAKSRQLIDEDPSDPFHLYTAFLVSQEAGDEAETRGLGNKALQRIEEILQTDTDNRIHLTLLGYLLRDMGQEERSAAVLEVVAEKYPAYRNRFQFMIWTGRQ